MIRLLLVSVLLFLAAKSWALDVTTLTPIEKLTVAYAGFKEPMQFNVTLPASYASEPDKRYLVLFDPHPRSQPHLSGIQDWLSHNGQWPWLETIVVTPATYHKEYAALFEKTAEDPDDHELLTFFESHLLAQVDKNYRTHDFRIFSGFMGNGAFGLYVLLNRPQLFDAYIIATPSLADDFLAVSSSAKTQLPKLKDKMRFVYLAIGEHTYEQAHRENTQAFAQALTDYAPSELQWHANLDDKRHYMSRPIVTLVEAIELLFADYHTPLAPDSVISQQGVDAIIAHYQELSKRKYGFDVSAQSSLKALAKSKLENDAPEALAIYHKVIDLYPDSAYAYADLAAAYESLGQINKAIALQTRAVEKSKSMVLWHQNNLQKRLAAYKSQLAAEDAE
ncbi:tetratricopeptide repeat protein [Pseudoalteromonas sp. T1lg88]|uniref:tetratricopeptide repeat protein n=1 Tax=Pseudoalteromonas sp. T1lg88 TaxID=2077104 RepID=UPI000CF665B9|nr:tetratricopeptide repeat protein [Pseudoalteromonas sp. T1lg88]